MSEKYHTVYVCQICGEPHDSVNYAEKCFDQHTEWEVEQAREQGYV